MKLNSLKLAVYDNPEQVTYEQTMLKLEYEADRQLVYGIELHVRFSQITDITIRNC
jgi:hypothetical protein